MFVLKLLQKLHLLLLVARRPPRLLLALVIHHLLNHTPRLAVQVTQLRVLGHDLLYVDLGRAGNDMRPPLHLVDLI